MASLTEQGERLTLTPAEFFKKYGWKNDPAKVNLKAESGGERGEQSGKRKAESGGVSG